MNSKHTKDFFNKRIKSNNKKAEKTLSFNKNKDYYKSQIIDESKRKLMLSKGNWSRVGNERANFVEKNYSVKIPGGVRNHFVSYQKYITPSKKERGKYTFGYQREYLGYEDTINKKR